MNTIRSVCVYCGSSAGRSPIYVEAGQALGRGIARAGLRLVYGGGAKGYTDYPVLAETVAAG